MVTFRRLALASLVANVVIVLTGGAVRLTGSGLGCPTWPRCTDESYVATVAMGGHGAIEFGNRMLGGVVGLIALVVLVAALRLRPRRSDLTRLAALTLAGVLGQGVLGGVTVLTSLNPWTVAAHFALSMAVIAVAYALWQRAGSPVLSQHSSSPVLSQHSSSPVLSQRGGSPGPTASPPGLVRALLATLTATAGLVLVLGTLVTGSGPHAGDPDTPRMGFDPQTVTQLHTDTVFLLLGLTIGAWFTVRALGLPIRPVTVLLAVELAQGVIGIVQHATHLPALAVGLHMAGACAVWLAVLRLWPALRNPTAPPVPPAIPQPALAARR